MLTASQKSFVDSAAVSAVQAEKETGCPAALTLAQAIIESGYGSHAPECNCFGIKSFKPDEPRQLLVTREVVSAHSDHQFPQVISSKPLTNGLVELKVKDYFKSYPSLKEAFVEHGKLIVNGSRYHLAFGLYQHDKDLNKLIDSVAKSYATDPNYPHLIKSILAMPDVKQALESAQEKA